MKLSVICMIRVSRQYAGKESQKAPKFSSCAESEISHRRPQAFHSEAISHAAGVFHLRSKFQKSRKGFISLKRNSLCPKDKGCFFSAKE